MLSNFAEFAIHVPLKAFLTFDSKKDASRQIKHAIVSPSFKVAAQRISSRSTNSDWTYNWLHQETNCRSQTPNKTSPRSIGRSTQQPCNKHTCKYLKKRTRRQQSNLEQETPFQEFIKLRSCHYSKVPTYDTKIRQPTLTSVYHDKDTPINNQSVNTHCPNPNKRLPHCPTPNKRLHGSTQRFKQACEKARI